MRASYLVSFVVIFLIGCNPRIVKYLNPTAKYGSFESYNIVNVKIDKRKLNANSTQLLGIIESEIKNHMEERRGYVLSNVSPDLILRYELVSNARSDTNNNNGRRSIFNSFQNINTQVIYESVILLELLHKGKLIWQGSYDLNQSRRISKNEDIFRNAINRIFTTYPYKAGHAEPDPTLTEMQK